jgi:hypothetical protein
VRDGRDRMKPKPGQAEGLATGVQPNESCYTKSCINYRTPLLSDTPLPVDLQNMKTNAAFKSR